MRGAPLLGDRTVNERSGWTASHRALVGRTSKCGGDRRKRDQDYWRTTAGRFGALAAAADARIRCVGRRPVAGANGGLRAARRRLGQDQLQSGLAVGKGQPSG